MYITRLRSQHSDRLLQQRFNDSLGIFLRLLTHQTFRDYVLPRFILDIPAPLTLAYVIGPGHYASLLFVCQMIGRSCKAVSEAMLGLYKSITNNGVDFPETGNRWLSYKLHISHFVKNVNLLHWSRINGCPLRRMTQDLLLAGDEDVLTAASCGGWFMGGSLDLRTNPYFMQTLLPKELLDKCPNCNSSVEWTLNDHVECWLCKKPFCFVYGDLFSSCKHELCYFFEAGNLDDQQYFSRVRRCRMELSEETPHYILRRLN